MAEVAHRIHETSTAGADSVRTTREIEEPIAERDHSKHVAARVVRYVTGVVLALLAIRFVFALLGANPGNGLASFIYGITQPLVSPFFNLFSYDYSDGVRRFESFTLVAMALYALLGYGIARLMTLTRR